MLIILGGSSTTIDREASSTLLFSRQDFSLTGSFSSFLWTRLGLFDDISVECIRELGELLVTYVGTVVFVGIFHPFGSSHPLSSVLRNRSNLAKCSYFVKSSIINKLGS
jgi:hypothetical protein